MTCVGHVIYVTRAEDYERLIMLPEALEGTFDVTAGEGHVRFTTVRAAQHAWKELS